MKKKRFPYTGRGNNNALWWEVKGKTCTRLAHFQSYPRSAGPHTRLNRIKIILQKSCRSCYNHTGFIFHFFAFLLLNQQLNIPSIQMHSLHRSVWNGFRQSCKWKSVGGEGEGNRQRHAHMPCCRITRCSFIFIFFSRFQKWDSGVNLGSNMRVNIGE